MRAPFSLFGITSKGNNFSLLSKQRPWPTLIWLVSEPSRQDGSASSLVQVAGSLASTQDVLSVSFLVSFETIA